MGESMTGDATARPRLHVELHPGSGPYALLVHGAFGSRGYWAANVEALGAVCRPVVVELWGHGRSPSPTDAAAYLPDAYVDAFEAIRAELGAERWVTIGQSMGAGLTLAYGLAHPDRVVAQVITNCNSAFVDPAAWRVRHGEVVAPMVARLRAEGTGFLRDAPMNPATSRKLDAEVRRRLVEEFPEHDAAGLADTMAHTNIALPLGERAAAVRPPTLLTLGRREETFVNLLPKVAVIADLEVAELDCGHPVNAQLPGPWNEAVVGYLSRRLDRR